MSTSFSPSSPTLTSNADKEKPPMMDLNQQRTYGRSRVQALILALFCSALVSLGVAADAQAAAEQYGIESVSASLSTLQAGRHPDVLTEIDFLPAAEPIPDTENLTIELPPGLTANPQSFPTCPLVKFNNPFVNPCPQDSQIGLVEVFLGNPEPLLEPLYNLPSPEDGVARFGFIGLFYPYYLDIDLRSGGDYGVTVTSNNIPSVLHIEKIKTETWGVPADPSHDTDRVTPLEAASCETAVFLAEIEGQPVPLCAGGPGRKSGLAPDPFMTNPASCEPMVFNFRTTAYLLPGQTFEASANAGNIVECERVPFEPTLSLDTTNDRAGAPTGLEATLEIPQNEGPNTTSSAPLRNARVSLPEGMTINPAAADGLEACSVEQAAYRTPNPAACPNASKLGTVEISSPSLKRPIDGGLFLRSPEPNHLFRFWIVSNELGVNLKVPAEVELDQSSGRLTTVIEDSPQLPTEEVVLRFRNGARAPLRNPMSCGTGNAVFELGSWNGNPPVTGIVPLETDEGCGSGEFHPKLKAGTVSPQAGGFSPFVFDVSREDGEQNLAAFDVVLPQGLLAKLAGVPLCPEDQTRSGACPEASQIGIVKAAVGAGSLPLWVPQPGKAPTSLFLAGPYRGAPYSVVALVPAQAGPFDLGNVVVRSAIEIDPHSAQVTIHSDPMPQILQGVPIDYRHVIAEVDRSSFTVNPTSCADKEVKASFLSNGGATASASDRFKAAGCAGLGFSPKLRLRLKGGTRRAAYPSLRAVLTAKAGQANIRRVSVALPRSEFLEQAHIRTICTRVQFAADECPEASIYGRARAFTPLLDRPLEGPVYLRSSSHKLPDLVVDLKGQIRITFSGRIDSVNGGMRTTFSQLPDAPLSKFVLQMKGGKKGLLVNSRNLCAGENHAAVKMDGQNGRTHDSHPALKDPCGES
jgi:hypothetical protein